MAVLHCSRLHSSVVLVDLQRSRGLLLAVSKVQGKPENTITGVSKT